jgi:hypothetical protein
MQGTDRWNGLIWSNAMTAMVSACMTPPGNGNMFGPNQSIIVIRATFFQGKKVA